MSDGTNTGIIVLVILLGVVIVIGVAAAVLVLSNAGGSCHTWDGSCGGL